MGMEERGAGEQERGGRREEGKHGGGEGRLVGWVVDGESNCAEYI